MSRRARLALAGLIVAAAVVAVSGSDALLTALPVLGLLGLLWCGRYPGEGLHVIGGRRSARRRPVVEVRRPAAPNVASIALVLAASRRRRGPPRVLPS